MIALIIGLSLSIIAISILFYLYNQLKINLTRNNKSLLALHKEFTQYQVEEAKQNRENIIKLEIKLDRITKTIKNHSKRMDNMNNSLPSVIGQVVGQIEFAQDTINRK
tara:strand:+ start:243 stop:566 length:324 start_codon:yes stop_codon:yes gene_type:complete